MIETVFIARLVHSRSVSQSVLDYHSLLIVEHTIICLATTAKPWLLPALRLWICLPPSTLIRRNVLCRSILASTNTCEMVN